MSRKRTFPFVAAEKRERLTRKLEEACESGLETYAVRPVRRAARQEKRRLVEAFQEVEHRAVVVLPEATGNMDYVVG